MLISQCHFDGPPLKPMSPLLGPMKPTARWWAPLKPMGPGVIVPHALPFGGPGQGFATFFKPWPIFILKIFNGPPLKVLLNRNFPIFCDLQKKKKKEKKPWVSVDIRRNRRSSRKYNFFLTNYLIFQIALWPTAKCSHGPQVENHWVKGKGCSLLSPPG